MVRSVRTICIVRGLFATFLCLGGSQASLYCRAEAAPKARPNVVVIITDDQGHGDFGYYGNPILKTPNLDALARASTRLSNFHVSPVCSPTRSSLMTGRYHYRTGVIDTYIGRSLMYGSEWTVAELLGEAGYDTGIVGKWHLGDNYPLRPQDQGFRYTFVHKGGGLCQPAGPAGDTYWDFVAYENGEKTAVKGYCTDVFTEKAIQFVQGPRAAGTPFFLYLAFNAPHGPHQVDDAEAAPYRNADYRSNALPLAPGGVNVQGKMDPASIAASYGMITNLDRNIGRLLQTLDDQGLRESTLVIFLTDNGPDGPRYNVGLRGLKGTVFEGGLRVPCFLRWPGQLKADWDLNTLAAHIDLTPTVLDACGVPAPPTLAWDGVSLWSRLRGREAPELDRTLFFQWHRGDSPRRYEGFAVITPEYKLCQPQHNPRGFGDHTPPFLLFDRKSDRGEQKNVLADHPEVVARLRQEYDRWYDTVGQSHGYAPPRIHLGAPAEPESMLTRQDWRGPQAGWAEQSLGHWEVEVARAGAYQLTFLFSAVKAPAQLTFQFNDVTKTAPLEVGQTQLTWKDVELPIGPGQFSVRLRENGRERGIQFAHAKWLSQRP